MIQERRGVVLSRASNLEEVSDRLETALQLLARDLDAELFIMLTQVPMVAENYGRPNQRWLRRLPVTYARDMLARNQFPAGSMGPKIEAVIRYLQNGGKRAMITARVTKVWQRRLGGFAGPAAFPEWAKLLKSLSAYEAYLRALALHRGACDAGEPRGCTSLAAMVDYINDNKYEHILTVEDPIEFVHESKKCLVNQREVGVDTRNWHNALKNTLRQAPVAHREVVSKRGQ